MADDSSAPIVLNDADVALAQAPIAGLVLAADDGRVLRGNAAARSLLFAPEARTHALNLPADQALALLRAARESAASGRVAWIDLGRGVLEVRAGLLSDGALLTWLQSTRSSLAERLRPGLDLGLQATGIGLWERDVTTGESVWDAQCFALWARDPMLGPPARSDGLALVDADDRARADATLFGTAVRDAPDGVDIRLRFPDGSWRQLNIRSRFVRAPSAHHQRVVGVMLDVTATRRAEGEQRALADRLALVTDATGVGIWSVDADTAAIEWDALTAAMLGHPHGEPAPRLAEALSNVHPDDRERILRRLQSLSESGGAVEDDARVTGPDGRGRWLHLRALRDATLPRRLIGVCLDLTASRKIEAERRELTYQLRLAAETAGIGFWDCDIASGRVVWSERMFALYRLPRDAQPLDAEQWLALVHADDRARAARQMQRLLEYGEPFAEELRIVCGDDVTRDVACHAIAERGSDRRVVRVFGTALDVTQLRRAERLARAAAERLELATAAARLGVWDWRPGEPIDFDPQMCALYGLARGARRSFDEWADALHPEDRAAVLRRWHGLLAHGDSGVLNFRIVRPDGAVRDVRCEMSVFRDATGGVVRVLGTHQDVSELRAAERASQRTAERLLLATSAARIGAWEYDVATRELHWDAQMFRLFGREPDSAAPRSIWREALHAEDRARVEAEIQMAVAHRIAFDSAFRIVLRDGAVRWLAARGVVHGGDDGKPQRLIGVNWDATDARQAEQALRAKETAERANRAKSEFVSRMSHELRTPLNALLGFAQLLEMDAGEPLTPAQQGHVARIRAAGWHLLNLINDVLDLSRIESGLAAVAMEVVEIEPLVLEAMSMLTQEAAARSIRLSHALAHEAPRTVWGDGTRLKQVLVNLLSNAVKFNRIGGAVAVEIEADGEDGTVISVRDTGPGMTAEQIEHIFQPFNRRRLQTVEPEGSGIGLAISRRLVEQMRGKLEVESRLREGSVFRVRLRRAVVARLPAPEPVTVPRLKTREEVRGTVLYIEDHPANTLLVEHLLHARPNVRLFKAADGATGIVLAAACEPDVVLIDMHLPDMDGLGVLQRLRAQPETAGTPCVALTAQAGRDDMRKALAGGFVAYWTKPLDAYAFLEGIDGLLARRRGTGGDAGGR